MASSSTSSSTMSKNRDKAAHSRQVRFFRSVRVGNIEKPLRNDLTANQTAKIPTGYLDTVWKDAVSRSHLQWLMQKDLLGQDSILVGNESVHRRRVALAYAELTQRPVEVLVISSDTTESDLKQRRVLKQSSSSSSPQIRFIDQAPVQAAKKGHMLLLDGLEHAERNVLASLNNLLENREMPLEDGRLLGKKKGGVPIHDDFRVVALYNTSGSADAALDPPVRSRFSIRRVDAPVQKKTEHNILQQALPNLAIHSLPYMDRSRTIFPGQSFKALFARIYPFHDDTSKRTIQHICTELNDTSGEAQFSFDTVSPFDGSPNQSEITFRPTGGGTNLTRAVAASGGRESRAHPNFISTKQSEATLSQMLQEHVVGRDLLLLSPKGHGKSILAKQFSSLLGYQMHLFALYKEMTSTDLLIRRSSDAEYSPLLKAATSGQLCVLDGVEKLSPDTLAALQSLTTDRHIWLPDGTQLSVANGTIHPSFRIIALASTTNVSPPFLTSVVAGMFSHVRLPSHSRDCLKSILQSESSSDTNLQQLLKTHKALSRAPEDGIVLSLRTMKRIVKQSSSSNLYDSISASLRKELLPPFRRQNLESIMQSAGIVPPSGTTSEASLQVQVDDEWLQIGEFAMKRKSRSDKVPSPFFFDIPSHVQMIRGLLREWSRGERAFLLLGNQGTGKNKICDRLCQLANMEQEYLQLHRDSTIGQLTLTPSLENGKIIWKDSPLVRAVIHGRALVIDEADKAPLEVVAVLKSLVEDGELLLADGRRIVRELAPDDDESKCQCVRQMSAPYLFSAVIQIHPDFTTWVLANRPGRLFHGNDFHAEVGDCFSSHIIPNPDQESEIKLLRSYAPSLDTHLLSRITKSFSELRKLFETGALTYPYSTREAVAIVKHFHEYPNDDEVIVLHNVLDLDTFDSDTYKRLGEVFRKHGFKFDEYKKWKAVAGGQLTVEYVDDRSKEGTSSSPPSLSEPKEGKWDEENKAHVGGNQWQGGTGGSDTAGLGGRGGPYRLDRGHKVHQVSDDAKAEVSEEAKAAARRIAKQKLRDRLNEINMSGEDFDTYNQFIEPIRPEISTLRSTLRSVELKSAERNWMKRQLDGELDDSRIVEGVAGEKHIFKRRNKGTHRDTKKRHLRFVVDCSGSMYRFNGYDQRLTRCLQATTLIMESFENVEEKFDYSIVGHSGDSKRINLVGFGNPPANPKERLGVLHNMVAHSQFCDSGDNTLGAMQKGIRDVAEFGEESIVIAISDANLERYGIAPRELALAMKGPAKAYCIFIATFGDEALKIKRELPPGRAFVCMDSSELPSVVRNILECEIG